MPVISGNRLLRTGFRLLPQFQSEPADSPIHSPVTTTLSHVMLEYISTAATDGQNQGYHDVRLDAKQPKLHGAKQVSTGAKQTICYLAIANVCVIIILSKGNTQISLLLLCFLHLFVELMTTINEYI